MPHNQPDDEFELTPETLQQKLNEYSQALEEEFKLAEVDDPEHVDVHIKKFFSDNRASAMAQIVWLSNNASSEATRLAACKFVIEAARDKIKGESDPIKDLLTKLTANNEKSKARKAINKAAKSE